MEADLAGQGVDLLLHRVGAQNLADDEAVGERKDLVADGSVLGAHGLDAADLGEGAFGRAVDFGRLCVEGGALFVHGLGDEHVRHYNGAYDEDAAQNAFFGTLEKLVAHLDFLSAARW